jgi:2-hydroxychromene-2-carboxylate isomerase
MLKKALRDFIIKRTFAAKLRNKGMNTFSNFELLKSIRSSAELKRTEENRPHEVMYFHKVDDPYSHLAIQYIDKLQSSFDISFQAILVGEENSDAVHEPSLYSNYCLDDAKRIAPFFGVEFSAESYPSKELVTKSNKILTAVDNRNFGEVAKKLSSALWSGNELILDDLAREYSATDEEVSNKLELGNLIRNEKDYYFGSAFYYEKELYWGVDRLHHLEDRLIDLGLKKDLDNKPICAPTLSAPSKIESEVKVNLYYYPSLNSPYTYVSAKRVRQMKDDYPIDLITKPVLPMLMRNMTIPAIKGKYIISDAAREGRKNDYPMGSIYSPIGKPARKAYSLFPVINEAGKGFEYIDELLRASFYDGINIGEDEYLESLITKLDLDWSTIKKELNTKVWQKVLDDNLKDMYEGNCWGVPSFKITDSDGSNPFYVWGQDRMWLLKEEINRRLG